MLTFISSLLVSLAFAGSPAIFSGQNVKLLKQNLDFGGVESILTGTADPSVSAQSAPEGSLYLSTNGNQYVKQDAGSSTNWNGVVTSLTGDVTASGPGASAAIVVKIRGRTVSSSAPSNGQFLLYNSTGTQWEPSANLTLLSGSLTFANTGTEHFISTASASPDALTLKGADTTTTVATGVVTVRSGQLAGSADNSQTGGIQIATGDNTSSGLNPSSGNIQIATGSAPAIGVQGDINLDALNIVQFSGPGGLIGGATGAVTGAATSGDVQWITGGIATGTSGSIDLFTGSATGAGTSGSINLEVGTTVSGTGGNIVLQPGSGTTNGAVELAAPGGGSHPIKLINPDSTAWSLTLPVDGGTNGYFLKTNGSGTTSWTAGSSGTVTSVALTVPSILSVSGSPITTSGTLAVTLANQSANLVFAGPSTGAATTPTFRALVGADLPNPSSSSLGGVQSITSTAHNFLTTISTSGVPSKAQPACSDLSNAAASCSTDTTVATNITTGTLGSTVQGNITTVGTISSGTWNGTGIDVAHGGTGRASLTNHGVLVGATTSAITQLASGSAGQMLQSGGASADPAYSTPTYPTASGSTGVILRSDGTNNAYTTATYPNTASAGTMLAAASSNTVAATATPTLGAASGTTGSISFVGTTSGTVVLSAQDAAGSTTFKLPSADGSSGQVMKTNGSGILSFVAALTNPASAAYDTIYQNTGNTAMTNLANGTTGQVYMATTSSAPSWATVKGNATILKAPSVQSFTSTGTQTGWLFTISTSSTLAVGDTYTNNSQTFTVQGALTAQSGQVLFMSGTGATSGTTLTRSAGAGTSSITFSTKVATATYTTPTSPGPLYIRVRIAGAGGAGGGGGTSSATSGTAGLSSFFGANILSGVGGALGSAVTSGGIGGAGGTASLGAAIGEAFSGGAGNGAGAEGGSINDQTGGGMGGANSLGGGGGGGGGAAGVGNNGATNTGAGGGGGSCGSSGASAVGAGGGGGAGGFANGIINAPAATYPYVIGTGGTHGNAGTAGGNGGDGAAGIIVVYEHYQ